MRSLCVLVAALVLGCNPSKLPRSGDGGPDDSSDGGDPEDMVRRDGPALTTQDLRAVWGSGDVAIAVGAGGTILRWDGSTWLRVESKTTADLYAVWGAGPAAVWAVGAGGVALFFDGATWTERPSGTTQTLLAIHGRGVGDIWAVGEKDAIVHWDGTAWMPSPLRLIPMEATLRGVWISPENNLWEAGTPTSGTTGFVALKKLGNDTFSFSSTLDLAMQAVFGVKQGEVWAVGDRGLALRYTDQPMWSGQSQDTRISSRLNAVHGRASDDVWAVGDLGAALHWNGAAWSAVAADQLNVHFYGVWASATREAWAVGQGGTLIHLKTE